MESVQKKRMHNLQRLHDALQQETTIMVEQLASQIHWISKVNGILGNSLSLVSKDKTEILAASCEDRWFARFFNRGIDVIFHSDTNEPERERLPLEKIRLFDMEVSGMKFDTADRLWIVNTEGFVEILDIRRSSSQLTPHRYFVSKIQDKTTHSRRFLSSTRKDDTVDSKQISHGCKEFKSKS